MLLDKKEAKDKQTVCRQWFVCVDTIGHAPWDNTVDIFHEKPSTFELDTQFKIFWPMGSWVGLPETHLKRRALCPIIDSADPHRATTILGSTPVIEKLFNTKR